MTDYQKDEWGYPRDPQIRALWVQLGYLVGQYYSTTDIDRRQAIIQEYQQTMAHMYALGWDDILDWDSTLPFEDMPKEYQERVGPPGPFDANAWKMPEPRSFWQRLWDRLVGPPKG